MSDLVMHRPELVRAPKESPIRSVATVVADGTAPFEFGVVCEVFGVDRSAQGGPKFDHRVVTEHPGRVWTNQGFGLVVDNDLSFADEADVVVIPALWNYGNASTSPAVLDLIRRTEARGAWLLSVCSGAFVLAEAGVLNGRRSTTHWMYSDRLADEYPGTTVDCDVLFVEDRHVITSAGTAAGIDSALHLVRRTHGAAAANVIARRMVVPPQRDGGQSQYIMSPLPEVQSDSFAPVTDWMIENLADDLSIELLAEKAHMSPRTFARKFRSDLGTTPAAWLNRQRLIRAQELLETSDLPLEQIAQRCGFGTSAVLRHHFAKTLQTTPTAYRATFSC